MQLHIPEYLYNPRHAISVLLVGAGGTGSEMLTKLGRIAYTLNAVYDRDLMVTLVDHDTVQSANLGRQLFCTADLGRFKSQVLIERANRFYGTNWEARPEMLADYMLDGFNIIITCTDNVASRRIIHENANFKASPYEKEHDTYFWLDMGNDFDSGNIILSSTHPEFNAELPNAFEIFENIKDNPSRPSCSLAEAIEKQHLMVNPFIADLASVMLWEILTSKEIDYQGIFFNLDTMRVKKVPAGHYGIKYKAA